MSLGSPVALPGSGCGGVLKCLMEEKPSNSMAFSDAMKQMQERAKKNQQEEEESLLPRTPLWSKEVRLSVCPDDLPDCCQWIQQHPEYCGYYLEHY